LDETSAEVRAEVDEERYYGKHKWDPRKLEFHYCIHLPPPWSIYNPLFIGHQLIQITITLLPHDSGGIFFVDTFSRPVS
jgi:hypothetical protein